MRKSTRNQCRYTITPCNASYPVVHIQQAARNDGVQENIMSCYNVIQILSQLDLIPQLITRALQHLESNKHNMINNPAQMLEGETGCQTYRRTYLKCDVILHLMDEVNHLGSENVTLVQHTGELCANTQHTSHLAAKKARSRKEFKLVL